MSLHTTCNPAQRSGSPEDEPGAPDSPRSLLLTTGSLCNWTGPRSYQFPRSLHFPVTPFHRIFDGTKLAVALARAKFSCTRHRSLAMNS